MINRDFEAMTVNGICDLGVKNIFGGSPLTLGANGYKKATKNDKFVGLSLNYYNEYQDDVNGGEWFADSKMLNIVQVSEVTLDKDLYFTQANQVAKVTFEITTASTTAGSAVVTLEGVDGSTATIGASKTVAEVAAILAAAAPAGWTGISDGAYVTFTKTLAVAMTSTDAADNKITFTTTEAEAGDAVIQDFIPAGSRIEIFPYDNEKVYAKLDELYVDANGVITNDATVKTTDANGNVLNYVGYVVEPPTATVTAMKIHLNK